ncbi:penicillin-binding protein [Aureitalea marina]|uniref:Penicillin-binding protein n=1 Tax=Aureitalea marina TaxID=930804 RepID=A0A2S7KM18_9FLAO|nr:penicillin-binding protein [Aureitalea marina]PQB03679.1 penicillin-binding protein [Aureitalea marina]
MATEPKHIMNRLYFVAGGMFIFALAIVFKLVDIQFLQGDRYRDLARENTMRNYVIEANRGNIYADDGSLLATSVPKYEIRFDAVTVSQADFNAQLEDLSKALSQMLGRSVAYHSDRLRKARADQNRYLFIAEDLGYSDYVKIKGFPLFKLGPYRGGFIVNQRTVREHPLGKVGERIVGNESRQQPGHYDVGLEGAFNEYLTGKAGRRLQQKIAKGQWKPVSDENEVEPQDGLDIITTINVNIQDIAHHALLKQLEYYEAEHGSVVVMDVKSGEIKAVSNLGRTKNGTYYERLNYAVGESHEPGSTFKVIAMMAALEDKVIDTMTVVDTKAGSKKFYGRLIHDSRRGGYGKISAARALEVSSNIGLATIIDSNYADQPQKFIDHLLEWKLDQPTGIPIKGEGNPLIPGPGHDRWSKNALPSIAYGYNLQMTPLQTLTFYNAIANGGVMVKPRFIKEIRVMNKEVQYFDTEVMHPKICSDVTLSKIQDILKNIVIRGTGEGLYSEHFSMAGKTGTARTEYWFPDWEENKRYISSFAGYFPAEDPKYSCIVVIHKPSIKKGYYGADVSGPVFKRIAQKIFTDSPLMDEVRQLDDETQVVKDDYLDYFAQAQAGHTQVPNVVGMAGMDAIALLENLGFEVKVIGAGTVSKQSLSSGGKLNKGQLIVLTLS